MRYACKLVPTQRGEFPCPARDESQGLLSERRRLWLLVTLLIVALLAAGWWRGA